MSKLFELIRRSEVRTSLEDAKKSHWEVVRVFSVIRFGRSPLRVEGALKVKTRPRLVTEIFPLGHTNYFICCCSNKKAQKFLNFRGQHFRAMRLTKRG